MINHECPRCGEIDSYQMIGCHDTCSSGDEITGLDVAFNISMCECGCVRIEDVWSKPGVVYIFQREIIKQSDGEQV